MKLQYAVACVVMLCSLSVTSGATGVDSKLPSYTKMTGVSGKLTSVGSDTLANLMTLWSEAFKRLYPGVSVQIQAAGSSTAPPALIEGTSNFGPMSRPMKYSEVRAFEDKYGYKPTGIPVAVDAIAIFVHKDNPVSHLTIEDVDGIFSSTRKCGGKERTQWNQLGVGGALGAMEIQIFGRNSVSGTYGYFKDNALCKGDFRTNVNEQPGSSAVVQSVTSTINAIGYSGIGYRTVGVRSVPLSAKGSTEYYDATMENALSGDYPISRFLMIYINKAPNKPMRPTDVEFMRMVLSKQGQEVVMKDGYVPLTEAIAAKFRNSL